MKSLYEELREERIKEQEKGNLPEWFTTNSWQMFKGKYLWEAESVKEQMKRISKTAAKHSDNPRVWSKKFFNNLWRGWMAGSTPVLSNTGTNRGLPVSCSANYVGDSIYDFYNCRLETAVLSQNGFGTASDLSDIRPRGSSFKGGGVASGVVPVFKGFVQMSRDVTQGGVRRGAWAGYLPIDHDDFWELSNYVLTNPDDSNVGWKVSSDFINLLEKGDKDALSRYQRSLKIRCTLGKGYYWFPDKVNNLRPECYKHYNRYNKSSNLCTEITLSSDEDHTYTCILSSMNLAKYNEWKDTDAIFVATVFLDCIAQEFIERAREIKGLERAVRYTEKSRALGLGTLGFHTYLQQEGIALESFEAHMKNLEIFKKIHDESLRATQWMAKEWGEPEWCKGFGLRNTHRTAIAPNLSSSLICGSVSQGIEPIYSNVFTQLTAGGEMNRINPVLLNLMKERKVFNDEVVEEIGFKKGSVQHVDWLSDQEKMVFKTAFEVDQRTLLRLASTRQPHICQAQSLNLFFSADEEEEYISQVHKEAFLDPNIKSLYYLRSSSGIQASKGECVACEG
jgi:ribonucleoside-diphosphate reductase alpha chain